MGRPAFREALTSDVLAQTSLDDAAHVNMIDLLGFHVSTVQGLLDDDGAQLCSRDVCRVPPNLPIAVRQADAITIFFMLIAS